MAKSDRGPDRLHNLPVVGRVNARDHKPERVGSGVDRRELDGLAES
jgi:hypothetical protein